LDDGGAVVKGMRNLEGFRQLRDADWVVPPRVDRNCLCCKRVFPSTGAGNRLCDRCRARDASPFEP
jgi:hypothetical protein